MILRTLLVALLTILCASSALADDGTPQPDTAEQDFMAGVEAIGAPGQPQYRTARIRFARACDGGHSQGCMNAAPFYRDGLGGAKDLYRSRALYQNACVLGEPAGCKASGQIVAAGGSGARLVSVMPETCSRLYSALGNSPRAPEVVAEFDVIEEQMRARTVLERSDFVLLQPLVLPNLEDLARNHPLWDEQVVEDIAACDKAFGFTPVATRGPREELISDRSCAVSFLTYTGLGRPPEEIAQWRQYSLFALGRHLQSQGELDPSMNATPEQLAEIETATRERFDRITRGLESTEGLTADAEACMAKYLEADAGATP